MPRMDKPLISDALWRVEGAVGAVVYEDTVIAAWNETGIRLSSGGWRGLTPATKYKMNQVSNQFNLGYKMLQREGEWFALWNGKEFPFIDYTVLLSR